MDSSTPRTSINSNTDGLHLGQITPSDMDSQYSNESRTTTSSNNTPTIETIVDNNIRNVFLESMCFIPQLVTMNGNAKLHLKLSDNITTWSIQTVGNTKDGKIGYGILDTVKYLKIFR
ncbi:MAG: alpha-2-macroglobulin family protein [Clostridia bacterium]